MILTCPECATSYFVDDDRIPARGRTVKCASCGARWTAFPEGADGGAPAEGSLADFEPASAPPPSPPRSPQTASPETAAAEAAPPDPAPSGGGAGAKPSARKRSGAPAVVAGVVAVILILLAAAAIMFRSEVAQRWPFTAGVYSRLGLAPRPALQIEALQAKAGFEGGQPVLSVTGRIRNTGKAEQQAPPLQIQLLDEHGEAVAAKTARAEDPTVPGGADRYFVVAFVAPPQTVRTLQVDFLAGRARAAGHGARAAPAVAPAASPAPQPEEAKPLPPDAPDALPDHG